MANVPNLRFFGYDNNWIKYKCSDLLESFSTNSLTWDNLTYCQSNLRNIHYGLIHNGFNQTCIKHNDKLIPYVKEGKEPKNYTSVLSGDLILADASEDRKDVGRPIEIIECTDLNLVSGLHTIHSRDKINVTEIGYKGFYFQSKQMKEQLFRITNGSKIYSISPSNFSELYMSIPSKSEQKKIVYLLQKIEDRIVTQIKIIEDKISVMNHLMYLIFNKYDKFTNLETFIDFGKAGGTPKTSNKNYYDGNIPFLSITDISDQGKYISTTKKSISREGLNNSSAWIVPKDSLILSMYASVGYPTINQIPLATSQAMYSMILKNNNDLDFLYYYLLYFQKYELNKLIETGTQSNINADTVKAIKIPIISNIERDDITKLLNGISDEISIEKDILLKYKSQKEYLLCNLFI